MARYNKLFDLENYSIPNIPNLSVWEQFDNGSGGVLVRQDLGSGIYRNYYSDFDSDQFKLSSNSSHVGKRSDYKYCFGNELTYYIGKSSFPYAEFRQEQNSTECSVLDPPKDINISAISVTPESKLGALDGAVTILATTNENSQIEYSLDKNSWVTNNVFERLGPGEYTAYVRINACYFFVSEYKCEYKYDQEPFFIEEGKVVAYGERYRIEFNDPINSLWEIIIQQSGYAGELETICGTGNPLEIIWGGSSGGRFQGIIGSEARIRIISTVNFQFLSLFTADDREYKVLIYRDGALYWTGYLMNDVYREDYVDAAYEVEVTARDGLGTLKDMPFLMENGKEYEGERTLMEIIFLCLKKLDLDLELWESDNWYEAQMLVGDDYSPLTQAIQPLGLYYRKDTWNCYEVLDRLLKSKCASLYQSDGTWHLTQDNWVYQQEAEPEPVVYPPIQFGLIRIGYGDQKGKVNLIDETGGDPLDGEFMVAVNDGPYVFIRSLPTSPRGGRSLSGIPVGFNNIHVKRERSTSVASGFAFFKLSFNVFSYYGQSGNTVRVEDMQGGETDDGYEFSDNGTSWISFNNLNTVVGGKGYAGLSSRNGIIYMRWRNDPESMVSQSYLIEMGFVVRKQQGNGLTVVFVSNITGVQPKENVSFKIGSANWRPLSQFNVSSENPNEYHFPAPSASGVIQMRYQTDDSYIVSRNY